MAGATRALVGGEYEHRGPLEFHDREGGVSVTVSNRRSFERSIDAGVLVIARNMFQLIRRAATSLARGSMSTG